MSTSIRKLNSFGDVAAEDDSVLDYFLTTDAVPRIEDNSVFLVLGRKGSGKTALVRHFSEGAGRGTSRALSLQGYPWNVHALRTDNGASEIEAYVASWRFLIALELAQLAATIADDPYDKDVKAIKAFLADNYGSTEVSLDSMLRPKKLKLSKASFEPAVMGNKLGGISLERSAGDVELGLELNALTDTILRSVHRLIKVFELKELLLHFDELDQGLSELDSTRAKMLVGLILAARAIRQEFRDSPTVVNPVVYLRSDVWDDLEFSDKNKISQTNTLHLEWTSDSLRDLIEERLKARLNKDTTWDDIATEGLLRGGQTKWNHILARTFLRPRDLISFLNAALITAKRREDEPLLIDNPDIVDAREAYSAYLKNELDDEILPHWSYWEEGLQSCSAIATITFTKEQFEAEYAARCSGKNDKSASDALRTLYDFSVIGYQRRSGYGGSSWVFQYSDPASGWDNAATSFKVHLGLKEYAKLKEERAG